MCTHARAHTQKPSSVQHTAQWNEGKNIHRMDFSKPTKIIIMSVLLVRCGSLSHFMTFFKCWIRFRCFLCVLLSKYNVDCISSFLFFPMGCLNFYSIQKWFRDSTFSVRPDKIEYSNDPPYVMYAFIYYAIVLSLSLY